ncbi:MAG: transglycosylase SLT domain-containing protein [Pyrinomonadaceae bacterium]
MSQGLTQRIALLSLLTLLSLLNVHAQTARERHEKIRASMENGDSKTAVAELQTLRQAEPSIFVLNNYDYLLARLSERRGDLSTAAGNYQKVVQRNSRLTQYALWHLAQFARSTGNLIFEREQLRRLISTSPESLLRDAAISRLARSYFESGDYPNAISTLRPRASATGTQAARESLALIGQAYLRSNQQAAAREVFNSLATQLPDASRPDDYALAAVRALDVLDSGSEETARQRAPQLQESEHLRRALIYNFNRDFAGARRHYLAIIERYEKSANVPDALYQVGRAFYLELNFDEAIKYFQRVSDQFPESPGARDALSFLAASYARSKRTDEAVAAYRRFIERYPNAPNPERPALNIIDVLRDAGRDREALDWVNQTRNNFKGQIGATLALFAQAKIHMAQNDWAAALADLDALGAESDLGGIRVPGGTYKNEINFLRAFVLEQSGRTDDAINAYLSIEDGRKEYYGWRATLRLRALATDARTRDQISARLQSLRAEAQQALAGGQFENARRAAQSALRLTGDDSATKKDLLDIARRAYASLPAYSIPSGNLLPSGRQEIITTGAHERMNAPTHKAIADELLFLELYDEGTPELAASQNVSQPNADEKSQAVKNQVSNGQPEAASSTNSPRSTVSPAPSSDARYTMAVFYKRGDMAYHAVRYAEPLWKNVPDDYLPELAPREMAELLYPAPYKDALLEYATQRNLDPRFVLAIMRQETRYLPEAKSASAARGLLQFIPSTADTIAAQLGLRSFRQDDLYDPRLAILFGSQYMANLFKQFPEMPQAVAAAYNGGEDNIARWVARSRSNDPDRYVSEIGFTQTKDYVFKVLSNYRVYQTLYDERLQRR